MRGRSAWTGQGLPTSRSEDAVPDPGTFSRRRRRRRTGGETRGRPRRQWAGWTAMLDIDARLSHCAVSTALTGCRCRTEGHVVRQADRVPFHARPANAPSSTSDRRTGARRWTRRRAGRAISDGEARPGLADPRDSGRGGRALRAAASAVGLVRLRIDALFVAFDLSALAFLLVLVFGSRRRRTAIPGVCPEDAGHAPANRAREATPGPHREEELSGQNIELAAVHGTPLSRCVELVGRWLASGILRKPAPRSSLNANIRSEKMKLRLIVRDVIGW